MKGLELSGSPADYHYASQGGSVASVSEVDRTNHRATVAACTTLGFSPAEQTTLWQVVAAVLHLVRLLNIIIIYCIEKERLGSELV